MLRVYISGPITKGRSRKSVDWRAVEEAEHVASLLIEARMAPLVPQSIARIPGAMDRKDYWLDVHLEWLTQAHAVLRIGGPSTRADGEVRFAKRRHVPVFNSMDELLAAARNNAGVDLSQLMSVTAALSGLMPVRPGKLRIHSKKDCSPPCPFHAPSNHHMKRWSKNIRFDRGMLVERMCRHGVGHPDPDSVAFLSRTSGNTEVDTIHGCDGCCQDPSKQRAARQ